MPKTIKKIVLTDRSLQAMKPSKEGRIVWDAAQPGMAVRIGRKGRPAFYVVRRMPGARQPTWRKLGEYPDIQLGQAREAVREALRAMTEGTDPAALAEAKRVAKADAERATKANSFRAVAEQFITRHAMTKRSGEQVAGVVRRELVPVWGDRPIGEIAKRDVIKLIEAILDRGGERPEAGSRRKDGGPYAARHALSAARKMFNWAAGRDLIPTSPCDRIKAAELHGSPAARTRVLTDDEIRRVWQAAEATDYPYGPLVKMLLLTGQRREEIAGAKWSEIDLDKGLLTIGPERMKAKAGHSVPLTEAAIEILNSLPRFVDHECVFQGQSTDKPFSGFSKAKKRLDKAIGEIEPFTLHDLRRTVRTRMAELGVTPFVGELVIAHTQKGVHAIYDLHRYENEKRDALELWEKRLLSIVAPPPADDGGNVVRLPKRAPA